MGMATNPTPDEIVAAWASGGFSLESLPKELSDEIINQLSQRVSQLEQLRPKLQQAQLEHFDHDDDLRALEQHIGRFNIFEALKISKLEIRHSNFLAWLLDPNQSHGQHDLFLNAVVVDMFGKNPQQQLINSVSLETAGRREVRIRREFQNIDILIESEMPRFVIAIENKVRSHEHSNQLSRYQKIVKERHPDTPALFIFLTRDGTAASDGAWTAYSYRDLHETLSRVRGENKNDIDAGVLIFLDHYLNSIRTWLMEDDDVTRLCNSIYHKHRRAIDLIVKRMKRAGSPAVSAIAEQVEKSGSWKLVRTGPRYVHVIPASWVNMLPPFGKVRQLERHWLLVTFHIWPRHCKCAIDVRIAPTKNENLRQLVIKRLVSNPAEFGLNLSKRVGTKWTRLRRTVIDRWERGEGPDREKLLLKVDAELNRLANQLALIPAALDAIIEVWRNQHAEKA
jgi:hypothetical protein